MSTLNEARLPWYREPWPWLLMLGPAIVVVAACYSAYLAVVGADSVIAGDYYTQGLHINRLLARDAAAARMGLKARAELAGDRVLVDLNRSVPQAPDGGDRLTLVMAHATRAGLDQNVVLEPRGGGAYAAKITPPAPGRWNVSVEGRDWRLTAQWLAPFGADAGGKSHAALELSPGG